MIAHSSEYFPLIFLHYKEELTLENVEENHQLLLDLAKRGETYAVQVEVRKARPPSAAVRKALVEMSVATKEAQQRFQRARVMIISSEIIVGAMTAIR